MTYPEAIQFLYGLQLFGANFGLERVRQLAALAGNPQDRLRFIHVAGTNGKGSVCALLESVYRAAGLRTGLFTSPHLIHFGERLQINRVPLRDDEVVRLVEGIASLLEAGANRGWWDACRPAPPATPRRGHPTFFEVVTVMALIHFAERGCEVVLWETGLGGRLDATNVVTPLASVITTIAIDHAPYLGDTPTKIAAEKSGIIKPGVPVITGVDDPTALKVILEVAASRSAPCVRVLPENGHALSAEPSLKSLPPGYPRRNARLALEVIARLQPEIPVNEEHRIAGLRGFHWPGRLQEIPFRGRRFLVDGAHNPAGLRALRETLTARDSWRPCPVIFGMADDKDVSGNLVELRPMASRMLIVPIPSPRTAEPSALKDRLEALGGGMPCEVCPSLEAALAKLPNDPEILITGSLYLAGEALERLESRKTGAVPGEMQLNDWQGTPPPPGVPPSPSSRTRG